MKYIKVSAVRVKCWQGGKRVPAGWLLALDLKIERLIDAEIKNLGSKVTLSAEDSSIRWGMKNT